jgi:hypothetical protein
MESSVYEVEDPQAVKNQIREDFDVCEVGSMAKLKSFKMLEKSLLVYVKHGFLLEICLNFQYLRPT